MIDIQKELDKHGIKTLVDLDRLRNDKTSEFYCESRFGILKRVIGLDAANDIMHFLSVKQCF